MSTTTTPTFKIDVSQFPVVSYSPALPLNPEAVRLIEWQSRAVEELVEKYRSGLKGAVLRGGTGIGKMYITGLALKQMHESGMISKPEGSINPFPFVWLCPKTAKPQTQKVLQDIGIAHLVLVMSYGELRTTSGATMFLAYRTEMQMGNPVIIPEWTQHMRPAMVIADERQVLKNQDALITRICIEKPSDVLWMEISATPWQRVADAYATLICCQAVTKYNALPCTKRVAPALMREIAHPKSPSQYSPSTVDRLRQALEPYIVEPKNVRFKFPAKTIQEVIHFKDSTQRKIYDDAYEEYRRQVSEGKRKGSVEHGGMAILVAMNKFKEKASLLRADQIAERAVARVGEGKQVLIGSDYLTTCRSVWAHLVKRLGVSKDRIGFIVGGQTPKERQGYVDAFQRGELDYIILTVKSGGVAISLHHDRPEGRPRHVIVPPTWSAIDLVQYLGRGHRLTSLSPTTQEVLWYADTIEADKVMPYVKNKVRCLAKAVTAKEQFITMFEKATEEEAKEASDELVEEIEETKDHEIADPDEVESEITGEGLENVDDGNDLPTT